jgi:hypothetical protein
VTPSGVIRQQLLQKIQDFTQAWSVSDTLVLRTLLGDEYQHTDIWGKILHKKDWLTYAATPRKIDNIVMSEVNVLLYLDKIAVITGKMSYTYGEQKAMQEIRFTQNWSDDEGKWKRTNFQATLIDNH